MKEILDNLIIYHTVDGHVKFVLSESDYDYLQRMVSVCDDVLGNLKLAFYAEQNETLRFSKHEMEVPTLSNYCLLLKLDEKKWKNIKNCLKDYYENKFKGEEE